MERGDAMKTFKVIEECIGGRLAIVGDDPGVRYRVHLRVSDGIDDEKKAIARAVCDFLNLRERKQDVLYMLVRALDSLDAARCDDNKRVTDARELIDEVIMSYTGRTALR